MAEFADQKVLFLDLLLQDVGFGSVRLSFLQSKLRDVLARIE